ncbi:MAG: DivIVA domain-containing protein, partial [Ilumatobacteraceae bacterium]
MAASLSRPDPSSPASVAEAGFSTSRRGYTQDEVRAFLTSVAAELGRMQERERQLEAEVEAAQVEAPAAPELDEETVAALVGEETLHVLQTARESASQIKIRAEETAAKVLREANDEVNRVRQDAEVEAARKRHDATSDAEAEVSLAKQQGREMVNEARAYRERVLADLERRTKVARQQIEDLIHGRDRLMQVFERARLVAVDVTSELQSIDGPEEFVNLSPTTGPLPLMLPATERPGDAVARPDDDGDHLDPVDVHVDEFVDEPVGEPTDEVDGTEVEAPDDDDDDDHDDDTVPIPATKPRDANVVSLFRDRPGGDGGGESDEPADAADEPDVDDVTAAADRPDVNGIFERLRSESPTLDGELDEPS